VVQIILSDGPDRSGADAIVVTSLDDSGPGSLRQAILDTNAAPGPQTITFASGLTGTIPLASALPRLSSEVNIVGPGASNLTVRRNTGSYGVFYVTPEARVAISGLTVSNGSAYEGAGFYNLGTLNLTNCLISGNHAGYYGGGVFNGQTGTLSINRCTIVDNVAGRVGTSTAGGGFANHGHATVVASTINRNTAGWGGGVHNGGPGPALLTVTDSTVSNNSGGNGGGVINSGVAVFTRCTLDGNTGRNGGAFINLYTPGDLTLNNCTLSGNSACVENGGGGIYHESGQSLIVNNCTITSNRATEGGGIRTRTSTGPILINTIVAGNLNNSGTRDDVQGAFQSTSSHNVIGVGVGMTGITAGINGNQVGTAVSPIDPHLGPLKDNGGPTFTHALEPESPAIDAGVSTNAPATDQRGLTRIANGTIDIGAYELQRPDRPAHGSGGRTAAAAGGASNPAASPPEKVVRKLPGTITDVVAGGGGRYLFLVLKDIKKLAVFDANVANMARYLPLASDEVLVAAGSEKLVLVYPDQRLLQRWQLGTFEKELTKPLPFEGVIKAVALGSNSTGPMLVHWAVGSGALDRAPISFLDISTLSAITDLKAGNGAGQPGGTGTNSEVFVAHYSSYRDLTHWRASADGRVFGAWCTSHTPSGLFLLTLQGKTVRMSYEHESAGYVIPGPDCRMVYTGSGGLFTDQLKAVQRSRPDRWPLLPSSDPNYYISVGVPPVDSVGPRRVGGARCGIYIVGNGTPIFVTDPLDEMGAVAREQWATTDLTFDKRYHFLPPSKMLVTIPTSNDQVVVRQLDIMESLRKSGVDYLFVTSSPPRSASRGETLTYRLEALSSRGDPKFTLESGPDGMSLTPGGELRWLVPGDYAGDNPLTVIISATDGSGQQTFHTFLLRIR
jgi:hypothetical protein